MVSAILFTFAETWIAFTKSVNDQSPNCPSWLRPVDQRVPSDFRNRECSCPAIISTTPVVVNFCQNHPTWVGTDGQCHHRRVGHSPVPNRPYRTTGFQKHSALQALIACTLVSGNRPDLKPGTEILRSIEVPS